MRIIIAPAKKMRRSHEMMPESRPVFLNESEKLLDALRRLTEVQRKAVWACSDSIAIENEAALQQMNLESSGIPAILAYDGIQYVYMAPETFSEKMAAYANEHLRILSGFYGVLSPMDGVLPYRLEMQAKLPVDGKTGLYAFWGSRLYEAVLPDDGVIINLASKEYSRAIEPYLKHSDRMITCIFGEWSGDRIVTKGVYAKMARGKMVRYLAENGAETPEEMKRFDRLDYRYHPELSDDVSYVFMREQPVRQSRPAFEWNDA
ncbi:MAG: peroxide stress protein YaaA [Clostridia bacterium]|nr:peroxide stress protein YaaA [Clostridia bacterium]